MKSVVLYITAVLLLGGLAYADCLYDGNSYPEGTIRGPYICIDSEWVRR